MNKYRTNVKNIYYNSFNNEIILTVDKEFEIDAHKVSSIRMGSETLSGVTFSYHLNNRYVFKYTPAYYYNFNQRIKDYTGPVTLLGEFKLPTRIFSGNKRLITIVSNNVRLKFGEGVILNRLPKLFANIVLPKAVA